MNTTRTHGTTSPRTWTLWLALLLLGVTVPTLAGASPPGETIEVSDDFPPLEVKGGLVGGRPCTEGTSEVCLPEGCEIDTSRTHSTPVDTGGGLGQGGPGYGIFVSSARSPGYPATAVHQLDADRRCLTSRVRVCARRQQRGVYQGRHVLYGVCSDDGSGENPGNGTGSPGAGQGGCCGVPAIPVCSTCPTPEPKETCTFEIHIGEVAVLRSEGLDIGPIQLNLDGKVELQITGYAKGRAAVHPSGASWFLHHKKWGWTPVHRSITRVEVEKGTERSVDVQAEGIEVDISGGGAPELGSSDAGQLLLACDEPVDPETVTIDFKRVKTGPLAAPLELEVGVRFRAHQVSP